MYELSNVDQIYEDGDPEVTALRNLSLSICEEEIVALVGPSGCGKTTILRILAGLLTPSAGQVTLRGLQPREFRRRHGLGFCFQRPLLFPWRSVIENVLLPAEIGRRTVPPASKGAARTILRLLGLEGFEESAPHQLSGGMLQRAALARALLPRPALLLLDEPFSALDEITRERLWFDVRELLKASRLPVLLVTHSVREAVFLADRVLVLSRRPGTVIQETNVSLPHRRSADVLDGTRFTHLCREIRNSLPC